MQDYPQVSHYLLKNLEKSDDDGEYWDCDDDEEFCEDDYGFEVDANGFYYAYVDVPADLIGLVIGKKGDTKRRIERTSNCKIELPPKGSEQPVKISSKNPENVDRGRTQVELSIEGKRFNRKPGYFLSFSLAVDA